MLYTKFEIISLLLSEKIFEGFLPYMGMVAILVPAIPEKKMFKKGGQRRQSLSIL